MAVSMAIWRAIEKEGNLSIVDIAEYTAGHSLGEYTALTAAGAISLADAARLLRIRGNAMQEAVPAGKGGMAALIGVEFDKAREIADRVTNGEICQPANDNGGGQVVLSGTSAAIDQAIALAPEYGIKRAIKLPVSAPFHSSLMEPAAQVMQEALAEANVQAPAVPLIANVTAAEVTEPEQIKALLVEQVTGTVRWRESMLYLKQQSVESVVEVGAGKVLAGLAKRIDRSLKAVSIQTPEDMESFLKDH